MKFVSWLEDKDIELLDCPFCGSAPKIEYIGNDCTKSRKIIISCSRCHIKQTDAALKHDFKWLETLAVCKWNTRK